MTTLNAAPAIFRREATNHVTQFQTITNAYKAVGATPPTRALEIKRLVNDESQNVFRTAAALANEALLTDQEPTEWYADAVEKIKEAQAREALAAAFNRSYQDAVARALPKYLEEAANDLTPHADRAIKQIVTAVKELPAGVAALDPEAAIAQDAGGALNKARAGLTLLGKLASIYQPGVPGEIPPVLNQLLPVVAMPDAVREQVARTYGESVKVLNESQLAGTRTIRQLTTDAHEDIDLALINVARGHYEGITLSLATPQELTERRRNALTAYGREHISENQRVIVF